MADGSDETVMMSKTELNFHIDILQSGWVDVIDRRIYLRQCAVGKVLQEYEEKFPTDDIKLLFYCIFYQLL